MSSWLFLPDWAYLTTQEDGQEKDLLQRNGAVLVENGRITAVGEDAARLASAGTPTVHLPGQLLLPGLISGHTHAAGGSSTRGLIESGRSYARPLLLVETLSDEELDALTAYNLYEIVRGGCTTQVEMSLSLRQAEAYARVAGRWGVRGYVGGMIPAIGRLFPIWFRENDRALFESEEGTLAEIEGNLDFLSSLPAGGLVRGMMAPHAADTHTPQTLAAVREGIETLGTGLHIHLSQSLRETEAVRRLWGGTPTRWLADQGLFEGPVFGAHMTGLDWSSDPAVLRAHQVVYAHCPSGGGAGGPSQPYPEALGAGLSTNVAIDTHSNDMLENVKLAVLYGQAREHLLRGASPHPLRAPAIGDALQGATRTAADGLRRPDLGRLAPGAAADLIAVDIAGPLVGAGGSPPEPLHHLLYANGLSVTTVMIDGRFLVREGVFLPAIESDVRQAGYAVHRRLWEQLAAEGWF